MKKSLLLYLILLGSLSLTAQDTAMDWTRTECGTTYEHNLFAELDSGYVIIIDFVMMGCPSCIPASNALKDILEEYNQAHPGKVRFYSVGFSNSTTCPQLLEWKKTNGYKHPMFEKGATETNYYGGMGMPTIVVLGGLSEHKVYYNDFGYSPSENPAIHAAIDLALIESTVSATPDLTADVHLNVFPNPFTEVLTVYLSGEQHASHLTITDITGREFLRQNIEAVGFESGLTIPTLALPTGIWFVGVYNGEKRLAVEKVVKK